LIDAAGSPAGPGGRPRRVPTVTIAGQDLFAGFGLTVKDFKHMKKKYLEEELLPIASAQGL
jgi:hypothetical protein